MDRASRSELLRTVESQKDQLQRYETKLRDLVSAYKGLLKEKEALENSVKVLSSASRSHTKAPSEVESGTEDEDATRDPLSAKNIGSTLENEVEELRDQIATLSTSVSTLSEEKSKLQANYLAEKKNLKAAHEDTILKAEEKISSQNALILKLETDVQEWRGKLRLQQQEHEKEQSDHALMMKELQQLVAAERIVKESLENQLDEMKHSMAEKQSVPDVSEQYKRQIQNLSGELEHVRHRLKSSEEKASKPSPLLLRLQEEMAEMKAQHRIAIQQEQIRVSEAEEQRKIIAAQSEDRVSALEAKLSELSDVVGNYERLKFQDQMSIQRLRERVSQLDLENTALARAAHRSNQDTDLMSEVDDANLDVQALVDKITQLKGRLKLANERSEKPVDIAELLQVGDLTAISSDGLHKRCNEEYDHLKEEFERYKLRAQSVLKNKKEGSPAGTSETDTLKTQLADLKERLRELRREYDEQESSHKDRIDDLHKTMAAMQDSLKQEHAQQEMSSKQKLADMEVEIRRHRERTIALLAEKDREIEHLRSRSAEKYESQYVTTFRQMSQTSDTSDSSDVNSTKVDNSVVNELISRTSLVSGTQVETSILHFAQEQARKDVEISSLRKQKHSLEMTMRELQHANCMKEQQRVEEIENLKEEIRRLERGRSRESANLEYLKNVVYHYMISYDPAGRQQMLNAIATILQFSPREQEAVEKHILGGWWSYGKPKTSK